jgi:hypothetical protein
VADARERAAIELGEDASDEVFAERTAELLDAQDGPDWRRWLELEGMCLREYQARRSSRAGAAGESSQRAAARHRRAAELAGVDTTSAEYRDTLRGGEGPKRRKGTTGRRFRQG